MDIRTKLALALVGVALISMLALGTFSYRVSADLLQEISERQLDALAEAKEQDLLSLVEGWRNDVRLIRSRTQMRIKLREFQVSSNPQALADIERILKDALESTDDVVRIVLFDRAGKAIADVGDSFGPTDLSTDLNDQEARYSGLFVIELPHLVFQTRVRLDDETIGGMEIVVAASELQALARNYRGLGETGETIVVAESSTGQLILLHGLRHGDLGPILTTPPQYIADAVGGIEHVITENVYDYRDKEVWVATRSLDDPQWGLIIKIDADEEEARALDLREQMIDVGLALGAFAIVGGTLLGFFLARPIRELVSVIERVQNGETDLRANAKAEDEIGLLAETLNEYLDKYSPAREEPTRDDRST
ncbi:MAG: HAMP domain-containing protein [Woeseia sp.]|nr:HAMP domain-containing protein [Woeseia sp.]MBT8096350.1 HAMP domain-containing protein [Woeseia sp.]NNE60514.1 HAMP domain-containing protein [Woeseia sp.]NNL54976.1 HAMP domain-containing protein [Woeseia sp.]